ncbi:MAG: hypothetical protein EOO70_04670 [Myxococcaceae bacterium]|nr:MAG: hypothetical protein EOO70_04670 [Myxococcaceae bacterium]
MPTSMYWMLLFAMVGCSTPPPDIRVRQLPNGMYEVDGPLLGPFETREELAQVACERMIQMPGWSCPVKSNSSGLRVSSTELAG